MTEQLVHPLTGQSAPAAEAVASLMEHLTPALEESGDLARVTDGIERLTSAGTGSQRQTQALHNGGIEAVLELITVRT